METSSEERWTAYGRALVGGMQEVLTEAADEVHPLLLETADYWLSVGLAMGLRQPADAASLLALIEAEESNRAELEADAAAFAQEALG